MKKLITIAFVLLATVLFTQTTINSKNNKFTGTNSFTKLITVETKTLSGAKITAYDNAVADTVKFSEIGIYKKDTTNVITGSYATQHDLRFGQLKDIPIRNLIPLGAPKRLNSIFGYPSANTAVTPTDNRVMIILCHTEDTLTVNGFLYSLSTQGNFTGDNTNAMALFSYASSTYTLLRQTANSEAMFEVAAAQGSTVALTSPITIPPGYYGIGIIYNNSSVVANPAFYGENKSPLSLTPGITSVYPLITWQTQNSFAATYNTLSFYGTGGVIPAITTY